MFVALSLSHQVIAELRSPLARLRKRDAALCSQITRAASSIALNIAEGAERVGADQLHHYRIAAGSCREVRSALQVAIAWGHLTAADVAPVEALLDRQSALLYGLTTRRAA